MGNNLAIKSIAALVYLAFTILYSLLNFYLLPGFIIPFFFITGITLVLLLYFGPEMIVFNFVYRMVVYSIFSEEFWTYLPENTAIAVTSSLLYLGIAEFIRYVTKQYGGQNREIMVFSLFAVSFVMLTLYGFFALNIQSPVLGYRYSLELAVVFSLSDLFGIVTILPLANILVNRSKLDYKLMKSSVENHDRHVSGSIYTVLTGYFLIMFDLIFLSDYYSLLAFVVYLPLIILSFHFGYNFAAHSVFLTNCSLALVYSYHIFRVVPMELGELMVFQLFIVSISLLTLFVGVKSSSIELERIHRREKEMQLVFAQKFDLVNRMAGGLAHEVNNTHQIINGYVDILSLKLEEKKDQELLDLLDQIQLVIRRNSEFMTQMLTISSKQEIKATECDINQILLSHESAYRTITKEQNPLVLRLKEVPNVRIDPTQFNQIVINLLGNAKDASPPSKEIVISTDYITLEKPYGIYDSVLQKGSYVRVTVSDSGHGIYEDALPLIFEPFYTTKSKGEGLGLGLSIVHGLVNMNRGYVDIKSKSGVGTEFHLYFPEYASRSSAVQKSHTDVKSDDIIPEIRRILIIDDETELANALARLLREFGKQIEVFYDPLDLLNKVSGKIQNYDLIISDIVMPGLSGLELVKKLRRIHPGLAVLLISGYTEQIMYSDELMGNKYAFAAKPFNKDKLIFSVNEAHRRLQNKIEN